MFKHFALAVVALALAGTVHAQGYRPNYYNYNPNNCGYQQQTYQVPYQPYYQYPAQKVIAQEIAVAPLIVTVPVESKAVPVHAYGSPYYYSVSQAYQEKAYIREILREELRSMMGGGGVPQAPAALGAPRPAPVTAPRPASVPGPSPAVFGPDDLTPLDLQQKVIAAYNGRGGCLNCHGAAGVARGPKGPDGKEREFRLVMDDGKGGNVLVKYPSDRRWKIFGMCSTGVMPPAAATDASKAMEPSHLQNLLQYAAIKDQ